MLSAAVTELKNLLLVDVYENFFGLTAEVKEYQADIYIMLVRFPNRLVEAVSQELCDECGPQDDDDGYEVMVECKSCGKEKALAFY